MSTVRRKGYRRLKMMRDEKVAREKGGAARSAA
jgi:hypothetical protein